MVSANQHNKSVTALVASWLNLKIDFVLKPIMHRRKFVGDPVLPMQPCKCAKLLSCEKKWRCFVRKKLCRAVEMQVLCRVPAYMHAERVLCFLVSSCGWRWDWKRATSGSDKIRTNRKESDGWARRAERTASRRKKTQRNRSSPRRRCHRQLTSAWEGEFRL